MKVDFKDPFNRASFYIERIKYPGKRPSERGVKAADPEDFDAICGRLFADAGIDYNGEQLRKMIDWYAASWLEALGKVPSEVFFEGGPTAMMDRIIRSVWSDGVLHGIAFGAGLESDNDPVGDDPGD